MNPKEGEILRKTFTRSPFAIATLLGALPVIIAQCDSHNQNSEKPHIIKVTVEGKDSVKISNGAITLSWTIKPAGSPTTQ